MEPRSPLKATELSSPVPGTAIVQARAIKPPPKLPTGSSYSVPCYLFTPGKALATTIELTSTLALILVYFVLPFEIAFVDAPSLPDPSNSLYIFNRLIDLAFTLDILANFCTAYETDAPDESGDDGDDDESILKRKIAYEISTSNLSWPSTHSSPLSTTLVSLTRPWFELPCRKVRDAAVQNLAALPQRLARDGPCVDGPVGD